MRTLKVYHGTSPNKARSILSQGLKSDLGYTRAKWYMVAEDFASAVFHAKSMDGPGVVLEIEIPIPSPLPRRKWPGFPYLWPPANHSWDGVATRWFALRQEIPAQFIKKMIPVPVDDSHSIARVARAYLAQEAGK